MSTASAPRWATWGLLAAWAVHDIEELITLPKWSNENQSRSILFGLVSPVRPLSPMQAGTAIGLTGITIAVASAAGARTHGRSRLYQCTLAAFGWHSVSHAASVLLYRSYIPGALTVVPVVIPFYLLARAELRRHGIARTAGDIAPGAVVLFATTLAAAHIAAQQL